MTVSSREAWYVLNPRASISADRLTIDLHQRELLPDGTFGKLKDLRLTEDETKDWPEEEHRGLLQALAAAGGLDDEARSPRVSRSHVPPEKYESLLPRLCATGRLGLRRPLDEVPQPLAWDGGDPYRLVLILEHRSSDAGTGTWQVRGGLERGSELVELRDVLLCIPEGLAVLPGRLVRGAFDEAAFWIQLLMREGSLEAPDDQQDRFLEGLWQMPNLPRMILPANFDFDQIREPAVPRLAIQADAERRAGARPTLSGKVSFAYGGHVCGADKSRHLSVDSTKRQIVVRDAAGEAAALKQVLSLPGVKPANLKRPGEIYFAAKELVRIVRELIPQGWQIEAEGKMIRAPGPVKLSVRSMVDWFELEGRVEFGGSSVALPELLAALKRGDAFITLGDGSQGMLPEAWLARYAGLVELGRVEGDRVRFVPSQTMILDILLASQPEANIDATFERIRDRLATFAGVRPAAEPTGFVGELRPYQREGLGWLEFLRDFGFGGCLADDMGLGKTVQVLALLAERQSELAAGDEAKRPSLVVVPRSVVHNWLEESARFTPGLKVLDFSGSARSREELLAYDVVISTYGTLLRDIVDLKDFEFDYAILDESQAVKNASSQSAKAVRLIRARHRLAMTGTPVENHLGELWSLFEFLNPGMLGQTNALKAFATVNGRNGDRETIDLLSRALRPFLLRRTKAKVLAELPEKTEQTLHCELDKKQRKQYDDLKKHYQQQLTERIAREGLAKSKLQVLEALLRLRQVACHPGLVDPERIDEPSAKLEALLEQLREILEEGHKALVFSQFTSLLAIVRRELDREQIAYEYLDGQTRNRQARVQRFQSDPACPLFLISLKAGGLGLNLTAADYVFILDPWWNPAVETQAVDRAHRIGQTKRVFAYRLIAKDTVEERILELQQGKRDLADAIITADNQLLANLTTEDLAMLLR